MIKCIRKTHFIKGVSLHCSTASQLRRPRAAEALAEAQVV
jgi:hypothetical protein